MTDTRKPINMACAVITIPGRFFGARSVRDAAVRSFRAMEEQGRGVRLTESKIFVDESRRGLWWNIRQALLWFSNPENPAEAMLLLHDDLIIHEGLMAMHLPGAARILLTNKGLPVRATMASLFTPPRDYSKETARGDNYILTQDHMWGPVMLHTRDMAKTVLDVDTTLDQALVTHHDEVRYRAALQVTGTFCLTILGSLANHRLDMPSTFGTAPTIAGRPRDTAMLAHAKDGAYDEPRISRVTRTKKDMKYIANKTEPNS